MNRAVAFVVTFFLLCSVGLSAQTLEGVICDAKTKEPVDHAVVYLNGTTSYTVTNPQGVFKLVVKNAVNTNLIVNHVAYKEVSISNPFTHIPSVIFLEEKEDELEEAQVVAKKERYTRQQKLVAFREQFLGETEASNWCTILNEDDIRLSYNAKTRTLTAKSEVPIEVRNDYLGYKVAFALKNFEVSYFDRSIKSESVKLFQYIGSSLFTDLQPENDSFKKRRDDSYKLSATYFFKNLINNTLKEAKYQLFSDDMEVTTRLSSYFITQYQPSIIGQKIFRQQVGIDPKVRFKVPANNTYGQPIHAFFKIIYDKTIESEAIFLTNFFLVDQYGNVDKIDQIVFTGSIAKQRLANMLPMDYMLSNLEL